MIVIFRTIAIRNDRCVPQWFLHVHSPTYVLTYDFLVHRCSFPTNTAYMLVRYRRTRVCTFMRKLIWTYHKIAVSNYSTVIRLHRNRLFITDVCILLYNMSAHTCNSRLHFRDNAYQRLRVETILIKFTPFREIDTTRWRARLKNSSINDSRCSTSHTSFFHDRRIFFSFISPVSRRAHTFIFYSNRSMCENRSCKLQTQLFLNCD